MRVVLGRIRHHSPNLADSDFPAGHYCGGYAAIYCCGSDRDRLIDSQIIFINLQNNTILI